jgi:catecholate siderophore receptor
MSPSTSKNIKSGHSSLSANSYKISAIKTAVRSVLFGSSLALMSAHAFAETPTDPEITLKEVDVVAPAIKDETPKGYNAKRSTTATRTDTELRDVPQAISVVTQDQIQDQSVQSVSEAVRYVPGVTAIQGEGNRDAIVFRGNATTGDFFVDGTRDDVQTYRDLYNTDRIEVLKGPSGMIFGRGGAGGVINRVSKEAGWDPISQITTSFGAYDHKRISGDYGQAVNDEIAFRINAVYEDSGSYRDGVDLERYGVTPTVTIKPDEKSKIVLGMEYFKDKRVADRGVPSVNGPGNSTLKNRPFNISDEDTFFGNADLSPTETETVAFNAMFEHAFDNGINVKNRTRFASYDKYYQNVFARSPVRNDGTVQIGAYRDDTRRENIINQTDITYSLKTGILEHKLLAGAEFSVQDTDNKRLTPPGGENLGGSVPSSNPVRTGVAFNTFSRNQESNVTVAAFYLQDQIIFSPQWQAIVGLRNDNFDTDYNDILNSRDIKVSDNLLSPRAGLIYKPVEALSLYANYSVSYVPRAGDQLTSLTIANSTFDPEKFTNREIGAKWDINPNLSFTAAVYKLERQNVPVADPNNAAFQILVDGQETKGVELSIAGNITDKWSIFGGYAFQDAELTKDQSATILKGTELAQTPRNTFSLWNRYDFNETWGAAIGVISRSDMYAAVPTTTVSTILPGYTRLDAAVFAKLNKNTRLQINLENLTNKEYALYAHNNNNITPGSPITGRATLIYNF